MQLLPDQTNPEALAALGIEAVELLQAENYTQLANRFGYALAFGQPLPTAIQNDLALSLAEGAASRLLPGLSQKDRPKVRYFAPNDIDLYALVECRMETDTGSMVLLELIVAGSDEDYWVTLEQISGFAAPLA